VVSFDCRGVAPEGPRRTGSARRGGGSAGSVTDGHNQRAEARTCGGGFAAPRRNEDGGVGRRGTEAAARDGRSTSGGVLVGTRAVQTTMGVRRRKPES
jgi:hypothetical protein